MNQLSEKQTEIDRELARLKPLLASGGLGFTGHLDTPPGVEVGLKAKSAK